MEILKIMQKIIDTKYKNLKLTLTPKTEFKDVKGLDSLGLMEFIIELEKVCKVQIADDKLLELQTVQDVIDTIEDLKKVQG